MKKLFCLLLSLAVLLAFFAACGKEPEPEMEDTQITEETTEATQEEETLPHETLPESPVTEGLTEDDSTQDNSIRVAMGEEYTCDLDGDGSEDTILCSYSQGETGLQQLSVIINGVECNDYSTRQYDYIQDYYYIVDLYTNDIYKELAILDAGPSDDPITVFFYYHDIMLEECGYVAGFVGSEQVTVHGDSTISAIKRMSVLQTWWCWTNWVVNENHALEEMPPEIFEPTGSSNVALTLKQDLVVYTQQDTVASQQILPAGTALTVTGTDNANWIRIMADAEYWVYLADSWNVQNGTETVFVDEIFDSLMWAD